MNTLSFSVKLASQGLQIPRLSEKVISDLITTVDPLWSVSTFPNLIPKLFFQSLTWKSVLDRIQPRDMRGSFVILNLYIDPFIAGFRNL